MDFKKATIAASLLAGAICLSSVASSAGFHPGKNQTSAIALIKQVKKDGMWSPVNQETEEGKMKNAFKNLKSDDGFRQAIINGDSETAAKMIQNFAKTDYQVTVKFKGDGTNEFRISIHCAKDSQGIWLFAITISRS
jgi:ABC-type sugar transport system substrate-binding protein